MNAFLEDPLNDNSAVTLPRCVRCAGPASFELDLSEPLPNIPGSSRAVPVSVRSSLPHILNPILLSPAPLRAVSQLSGSVTPDGDIFQSQPEHSLSAIFTQRVDSPLVSTQPLPVQDAIDTNTYTSDLNAV